MIERIQIHFCGDVDEDRILALLHGEASGIEIDADETLHSADAYVVSGLVIGAAQLAVALWQIHLAHVARRDTQAAERAARRAARRPLAVELHVRGTVHQLPAHSEEEFTRAVNDAIRRRTKDE